MNWEFTHAAIIPEVPVGGMDQFVIITKTSNDGVERHHCYAAYYLNAHRLEYEDCPHAQCQCGDDGNGCPTTGWFRDESNFDYDSCYHAVYGEVVAYAPIPSAEVALTLITGSPW